MISIITAPYSPKYISTLVYMLQSSEYHAWPYLKWYWRTQDFSAVMQRKQLTHTLPAKLLQLTLACGMALQVLSGIGLIYLWYRYGLAGGWAFGLALLVSYPVVWAHLIVVPLIVSRLSIMKIRERWLVVRSEQIFRQHKAIKIAVAGSYAKTSMKEILLTVLSHGKKVAATPANKNVALSQAQFARTLDGDEDILLVEYGEGAPGDVRQFSRTTHPTHAVITGVAAAHIDRYKTVTRAGKDIFSVTKYVKAENVYVNDESKDAKPFITPTFNLYSRRGALGWKVSNVKIDINGTSFKLTKGKQTLALRSSLIGRHQIGPLSLAAALAHQFGLTSEQIIKGISEVKPFEHRMQPYQLSDAWIIDDTYNGNIEGIRAGTKLLKELPATRKVYVTPGLVEQGKETKAVHEEMGRLIAASGADVVVLMQNSVTVFIASGLDKGGFKGERIIEPQPLNFYTNLNQFVAAGDLVLMQNDWPDNYA